MPQYFDGLEGFGLSQSDTAREIATELVVFKWRVQHGEAAYGCASRSCVPCLE